MFLHVISVEYMYVHNKKFVSCLSLLSDSQQVIIWYKNIKIQTDLSLTYNTIFFSVTYVGFT